MNEILLQLVWVAAHHGLRGTGKGSKGSTVSQWRLVHQLTSHLGNPPAPGGPR